MTAHSAAAAGASSTELRLVPIQGLNSVEKQTIMPKGMMALLQGLQFAVPTWGFNALFRGYHIEAAKVTDKAKLDVAKVWETTRTYARGSALPVMGTITAWFLLRDVLSTNRASKESFLKPFAVCALPSLALAAMNKARPPEAVVAGLMYAAVWHVYTEHLSPAANVGWKGGPTFGQR